MDNQIFPGGTYLDDMPQVCTLCGAVMNNARALYSHMQLHILSSNLGGQPPDPGLTLNPANILDLLAGVAQPGLPSSVPAPMLPPGNLFTPVSSVPNRLITPTLDLGLATLQAVPVPHPPPPTKSKEKKSSQSKHQSQSSSNQSSSSSRTSGASSSFQSFSKESKKLEESSNSSSKSDRKSSKDQFHSSSKDQFHISSKFDKVEESLGISVPATKASFDRPIVAATKSSQEPNPNKDLKLFQPFVTTETTSSQLSFLPKSNHFQTSSGLISPPISRSPDKSKDMDVLNTPQKINPLSTDLRNDDLSLPSETLSQSSHSGDGRHVIKDKAQEAMDSLFDKMKETPAPPPKTTASQPDGHILKTQFYPGILDPLNISPKTSQVFPRESVKDVDPLMKLTSQTIPISAKPSTSFQGDSIHSNPSQSQSAPMISPKIDAAVEVSANTGGDSSSNSTIFEPRDNVASVGGSQAVIPPAIFGNAPAQSGIPAVGMAPLRSTSPPVLGHTDPTKNPLGSGFFNALTQKLINPGLSMVTDFTKSSTPSSGNGGADPSSSKAYYENGVLLNHDYDKISDTNDEDDLERLIDIDPKGDTNIDSKSIDIIDDILNEFNERTEDANKGNKNQLFDLYNVLEDGPKGKNETKTDLLLDDSNKPNTSIIDELLEKEKEQIDREMRENAQRQATTTVSVSTTTSTCTSSTVTFSSTPTTSSVSNIGGSMGVSSVNVADNKADKKPEDDNIDFEIPKVGKLMKIRKYFESQEQKKKEQTQVAEKTAEIKIQQKKEPVVEEKPQLQTVLVQVSKRKKIEYGPYINRQSLLEGQPKEPEATEAKPAPVFRPKPRPHVPSRRTFNLRTRKTKTDFASLANKGAKNADGKRIVGKVDGKDKGVKKGSDSVEGDKKSGDEKDGDTKIVTRNKAVRKDSDKTDGHLGKSGSESSKKSKSEKDSDSGTPSLRTRSNRTETQNTPAGNKGETEGKSLRKRLVKPSPEDNKTKTAKSGETSKSKNSNESDGVKTLRSKGKTTPEKNDIKKCSVNLGENLSGPKLKAAALSTVEKDKQKDQISEDSDDKKQDKESKTKDDVGGDKGFKIEECPTPEECENFQADETDSLNNVTDNVLEGSSTEVQNIAKESVNDQSKSETKIDSGQANIFDVMSQDVGDKKAKKETNNETQEPEKKVQVIKLKLGAEIRKSLKEIKESLKRKSSEDLQAELETCTRKVSELQKQIESHRAQGFFSDKRSRIYLDNSDNDSNLSESSSKKPKHSVENEFQRLVNEAVEEVKKAEKLDSSGKQERYTNLRKRLNESVNYNVDNSDNEMELLSLIEPFASTPKARKLASKGSKITPSKFSPKFQSFGEFQKGLLLDKPVKKDVDVYDFTDTELSDKEDTTPVKFSSFKPKYVSNIGQKFPGKSLKIGGNESEDLNSDDISYVGKTVEPLKIKLTKIIPYKEKKHKHKKKKHKKDKDKKKYDSFDEDDENDADDDDDDDISLDSIETDKKEENSTGVVDSIGTNNQGAKKSKVKTKNHICAFCNQGFSQKCDLRKHEMIHTGERPWPCEVCDKKFLRKTDLAKHVRIHTGEKPYKCEFCDKRVSDKSQLNVHRRLHTGSRPYQCTLCGKGCITSSELTRHKATHRNQMSYKCELCSTIFKSKECLGMHMKLHYKSRNKAFKCDKCMIGFDQQSDLESHKCADSMPNMFVCGECFAEFSEEVEYGDHVKTHDLDVFSCNICAHVFEEKQQLETHQCTMGVHLQRQIHCEFCDKVFQDQASLAKHMPDHDNDEGSFVCDSCPARFTIRKDFIAHTQKHRISAFICNKCGTGFHDGIRAEQHLQECVGEKIDISVLMKKKAPAQYGDVYVKDEPKDRSSVSEPKQPAVSRASVISANTNFKSADSVVHTSRAGVNGGSSVGNINVNLPAVSTSIEAVPQNVYVKHEVPAPTGLSSAATAGSTATKVDILDSDKIFESSEFSNSPDFSSLTEDVNLTLGLNQFQKNKTNFVSQEEMQLSDGHKINAGKGNSGVNILGQADTELRKQKQFPIITSNLQSSHSNAQSDENRWIGAYQMSANDYVNSLLNKMETEASSSSSNISTSNKRSGLKSETNQLTDTFKYPTASSVENQAKTNIFPDFDFPVSNHKVTDLYQSVNKSGIDSKFSEGASSQERMEFQDININQAAFLAQPSFQEKADFSSFSNAFLAFPQSSNFNLTGSGSLFGGAGQNSLKQSGSNSLFTGHDLMNANYFLGVEESMKGSLSTDKNEDPAALLSNFDYDLN